LQVLMAHVRKFRVRSFILAAVQSNVLIVVLFSAV
jgi:hypothetical protein